MNPFMEMYLNVEPDAICEFYCDVCRRFLINVIKSPDEFIPMTESYHRKIDYHSL